MALINLWHELTSSVRKRKDALFACFNLIPGNAASQSALPKPTASAGLRAEEGAFVRPKRHSALKQLLFLAL